MSLTRMVQILPRPGKGDAPELRQDDQAEHPLGIKAEAAGGLRLARRHRRAGTPTQTSLE